MNKNNIVFSLNTLDTIVIGLEEPLRVVHCCYQAPLTLYFDGKRYVFPSESIRYMIQCLMHMLERALAKKLSIHESIGDLGYEQNEYFQDKPGLSYKNKQWVGLHNLLWSGQGLSVWLYNNVQGLITLEITPVYAYPANDPNDKDYIPYAQWIKSYNACVIKQIPITIAKEWLKQAHSILHSIEETMAREKRIYENNEGVDLTDKWYAILKEEYNITDPRGIDIDKVPAEFFTDKWWKKRGL